MSQAIETRRCKNENHPSGWVLSLCFAGILLLVPAAGLSAPTDLPYTSPSTGADGPLVIAATLPTDPGLSNRIQLAYHETENFLMAMAQEIEIRRYMATYGFIDGQWTKLEREEDLIGVSMVWDGVGGQMIRFGGLIDDTVFYQGLYRWDEDGADWDFLGPDGDRPARRVRCSMAYDAARKEVVMFGGENDDGFLEDTWTWNGTAWTNKTPADNPPGREWGTMVYDAAGQEIVLFGGDGQNDTWTWDGSNWTEENPTVTPPTSRAPAMAYDPNRQVVVLCIGEPGTLETWEWDGFNWNEVSATSDPGERDYHGLVYNPEANAIQLYNGNYPNDVDRTGDTWEWDGTSWTQLNISPYFFDMAEKPDGIWHYTTIDVGQTEVRFIKNEANTPVIWLASEAVSIDGHLNLDGIHGYNGRAGEPWNNPAPGGPGGFDGGLGGYYETATGADVAGNPGNGPGGGAGSPPGGESGDRDGFHATHFNVYNSSSLQALSGGSGGGGAASTTFDETHEFGRGGNGGGGGGAILIASSRDIWLNGRITAKGGSGGIGSHKEIGSTNLGPGNSEGGSGSGGSIRLVADRVLSESGLNVDVSSNIDTSFGGHDRDEVLENRGRLRIESYYIKTIVGGSNKNHHASLTKPKTTLLPPDTPKLSVDSIAGQNVTANPGSDPESPEVTFSETGPVTVTVSAQNIPDGTEVNLRVTSGSSIIMADPQILAGETASFSVIVPAGSGIVQAWTNWEVTP